MATYAGGVVLSPQPFRAPIPCETIVGTSSESADVGVLGHSLYYAPLLASPPPQNLMEPEEIARSDNGGATWTGLSNSTTPGVEPPAWMNIDPQTGRIWFVTGVPATSPEPAGAMGASICGGRLSWSDDGGNHWQTNPLVGCPALGAEKVIEGPAPAGGAQPHGYPHVVYYCANANDSFNALPVYCYKSLDGGKRFTFTGGRKFPLTANPDPAQLPPCTTMTTPITTHRARTGVVAPNGNLYFPTVLCGGALGVTVSSDEGASWTNIETGITGVTDRLYVMSIASDSAGNLYFSYLGTNGLPQLIISRDGAKTWSSPITATAPGLTTATRVAITAAGPPGEIALAYQGSSDGQNYNGYITESLNALSPKPVFWSASVNDPSAPLLSAAGALSTPLGDRLLYATDVMTPNGAVVAGFHCAGGTACPNDRLGVVGRLTWRVSAPIHRDHR